MRILENRRIDRSTLKTLITLSLLGVAFLMAVVAFIVLLLESRTIQRSTLKTLFALLLSCVASLMAMFAFIFLKGNGHPGDFLYQLKNLQIDTLVLIAPCIIFGITVHAYYHFITTYKGAIAGLSVIFVLIALVCCIGLAVYDDWWLHLRCMYYLFASYVCWDILMIELMLKPGRLDAGVAEQCEEDRSETTLVNRFINLPTLATICAVSVFCLLYIKVGQVPEASIKLFVYGVVSFHLIFSSCAYLIATHHWRRS